MKWILSLVALLALAAAPAQARGHRAAPAGLDASVTQFCGDRVCPTFVQAARPTQEARTGGKRQRAAERHHAVKKVAGAAARQTAPGSGAAATELVQVARRYIGRGNPTSRAALWCSRFMNMVVERAGYRGTGSDAAASFASWGRRVAGPVVGAIAVLHRRGGAHVGVVSAVRGSVVVIVSGNHGNRVAEAPYPRSRVYAYVVPRRQVTQAFP